MVHVVFVAHAGAQVMDKHLLELSKRHIETKFAKARPLAQAPPPPAWMVSAPRLSWLEHRAGMGQWRRTASPD
jgi:hypothetical protein